jgi:hypothetical protein
MTIVLFSYLMYNINKHKYTHTFIFVYDLSYLYDSVIRVIYLFEYMSNFIVATLF